MYATEACFCKGLEQALKKEQDASLCVAVKVISVGEVVTYKNKTANERKYVVVTVAESTDYATIRNYQLKTTTQLQNGVTVMISGLICKLGENPLWMISSTRVSTWAPIDVPESIMNKASTQQPATGSQRVSTLTDALKATTSSKIVAKVVQISPLKYKQNGELPIRFLGLKDNELADTVKMALFADDALKNYSAGDVISVTDAYRWKESCTLSTKKPSKVVFLPPGSLMFDLRAEDCLKDSDFEKDELSSTEPKEITVMGILSAHRYQCCPKPECRYKKIDNVKCPLCGGESLTQTMYYSTAVVVVAHDATYSQHKIFQPDIKALVDIQNIGLDPALRDYLTTQLPVNARGLFVNGKLQILNSKCPKDN